MNKEIKVFNNTEIKNDNSRIENVIIKIKQWDDKGSDIETEKDKIILEQSDEREETDKENKLNKDEQESDKSYVEFHKANEASQEEDHNHGNKQEHEHLSSN